MAGSGKTRGRGRCVHRYEKGKQVITGENSVQEPGNVIVLMCSAG